MGYYDIDGQWREGEPPSSVGEFRRPRQLRSAEERQADPNQGVRRQARRQMRAGYYDVDGNWIEPAPANTEETAQDVGSSFVAGVQRGVAGMAGFARDISDIGDAAVQFGARAGGASEEQAEGISNTLRTARDATLLATGGPAGPGNILMQARNAPSSAQILSGIEDVAGPIHEPETTAGEYARTIGEFVPNAISPTRGLGLGVRTARVVAPAVASEAAGQLTEGTAAELPARLIAALVGAGVSETTIQVLTRQGLTPDQRALRLIERELSQAGYSPEEIVRVANRLTAQAPTEEVLGELMGPSGQRLMRATAAMGQGAGRSVAANALDARATGRPGPVTSTDPARRGVTSIRDRVMGEASRTFGPEQTHAPNTYWDHIDTLRASRAAQGAENYRRAYTSEIDQGLAQQHLAPIMRENADAAKAGARMLEREAQRLIGQRSSLSLNRNADPDELARLAAEVEDVRAAQAQLAAIGAGEAPNRISTRAIDYFQRGIAQAEFAAGRGSPEAGALASFRRGFNELADQIAPALGDTRAHYGRSMAIEELTEQGRRVFNMSEGEIDRLMRGRNGQGLTTEEFDGFQLGVLDAIENKLGTGDTGFLARLARNANWRRQLVRATGSEANARRFMNRLAREANMQQTRNFVQSGSRTQPLQEDIRALTEGEAELSFMNERLRGLIAAGKRAQNPWDGGIRLATWLYDRWNRPGIANPQVQEAMARRLFGRVTRDDAKELRDALLAVRNDPNLREDVRAWINNMVALGSANQAEDVEPVE